MHTEIIMDDSGFQIVQKNDGQFEMVKLKPLTRKRNSKLNPQIVDIKKKRRVHSKVMTQYIYKFLLFLGKFKETI